jgi:hypothetical protein
MHVQLNSDSYDEYVDQAVDAGFAVMQYDIAESTAPPPFEACFTPPFRFSQQQEWKMYILVHATYRCDLAVLCRFCC